MIVMSVLQRSGHISYQLELQSFLRIIPVGDHHIAIISSSEAIALSTQKCAICSQVTASVFSAQIIGMRLRKTWDMGQ